MDDLQWNSKFNTAKIGVVVKNGIVTQTTECKNE